MKKELLSPAGNIECAYAAIHNGADAVYLSGKNFGARSFADNFSNEEISLIIKDAHLFNVKVYVTINTLITDDFFEDAIDFIRFLHKENVDAIILQDIGLAHIIRNKFPNLELHASTQMHNLDEYSFSFLKNLGFKRVVIARETSIDDINKIKSNLEIEAFIHGSLCISYSGECLFSSMAMNRSGNKGACSQLCRMPYSLELGGNKCQKSGEYLLSPKDLATFNNFDKIMESNLCSLKIEGRMKSVQYVALVTRIYRKLIDAYYKKETVCVKKEINQLKYLFNRGYTEGHILNDNDIMNIKRGNHKGVLIGKVISVDDKFINIKLKENLKIKDGIKFENSDKGMTVYNLYKNRIEIKNALAGDEISIPNNVKLDICDNVLKTYDDLLNEELKIIVPKKNKINIYVEALVGRALKITFKDGEKEFSITKSIVCKSENKEVSKEDIINKISKLGTSVYEAEEIFITKDENIFIRLSEINEARRELVLKLDEKKLSRNKEFVELEFSEKYQPKNKEVSLAVLVRNKRQLEIVKKYPVDYIYTDNKMLMEEYINSNMFYEVILNEELVEFNNLIINNTSDLEKYKSKNLILNYGFNVLNSNTLNYLSNFGKATYSVELNLSEISKIKKEIVNYGELIIYGKPKVMTMNHCLLFNERKCDECNYSGKTKILKDSFDRSYLVTCKNKINYIYNHKPLLKIRDLSLYDKIGIKNYRIDFFEESDYEIRKILNEYFENR